MCVNVFLQLWNSICYYLRVINRCVHVARCDAHGEQHNDRLIHSLTRREIAHLFFMFWFKEILVTHWIVHWISQTRNTNNNPIINFSCMVKFFWLSIQINNKHPIIVRLSKNTMSGNFFFGSCLLINRYSDRERKWEKKTLNFSSELTQLLEITNKNDYECFP